MFGIDVIVWTVGISIIVSALVGIVSLVVEFVKIGK